jgi:hypothetical protein
MMREHAQIGMAYGQQELAHDVRLACHGLDAEDNEFVIGVSSARSCTRCRTSVQLRR